MSTKQEDLLQRLHYPFRVLMEVASDVDVPLLKAKALAEVRDSLPKLLEEIHAAIVSEACNDRKPLTREQVLLSLKGIQNNQAFVVVFKTVKDDIREMFCTIDRERRRRHLVASVSTVSIA